MLLSALMYCNTASQSFPKILKTVIGEHGVVIIITRRKSFYEIPSNTRQSITAQHQRYCSSSSGLLGKFQKMTGDSGKPITRVLFCGPYFPASHNFTREYLQSYPFVEVDVVPLDDVSDVIGHYDICVVKSMKLTSDIIAKANKMKLIMQFGVGIEGIDISAATRHGIKVGRIPSDGTGNAFSCAEMAIYLMLGLLRKQNEIQVAVREKNLGNPVGDTLLGKTVFILGFGNIGVHLAKRLRPFGVKILATKRSWPSPSQSSCQSDAAYIGNGTHDDLVDEKGRHEDILKFARRADIVVCCLIMNSETAGIVDKVFISSMKKMSRRYDSRTTIFSPEGRLYQVEYAMEAIRNAGSAIGILATDGVVLVGEKKVISKLLETSTSVEKMYKIDDHVACAVAGIMSDANILINTARLQAQRYSFAYQEPMPVEQLVQSLSDTKQGYTQFGGLRPFGVSFLFAGWDKNFGFQLYMSDPSGNYGGWKAGAIGANNQAAQSILKQDYKDDITREEAVQLAIKVLSKTMDSTSLNSEKLELAEIFLSAGKVKFQICPPIQLNKLLVKSGLTQPSIDV